MPTNTSKYQGIGSFDPASETGMGLNDYASALGLGLDSRLARQNRASSTAVTPTATGTREVYTPGTKMYSNDPLQGTIFESGAFLGLDPLGIFDVPQIQTDIERLDPNYLADLTLQQAWRNALASRDMEQQLTPEVAAARTRAMEQLLGDIEAGGIETGDLEARLQEMLGRDTALGIPDLEQSQLLAEAERQAYEDLLMGGELGQDLQNLVLRQAAERGGQSGFLGGVIGRDLGARDLGLTSMDIRNQRMNRASMLGQAEQARNIQQQGLAANIAAQNRAFQQANEMAGIQGLQGLRQQNFQNRFGAAQFTQGINQPIAGIDPGDLASFVVEDINQRNQLVNQANVAQLNAAQQAKQGQNALIGDVAGGLMGMFCWVAREVYGEDSPKWKTFREWMVKEARPEFFSWYKDQGEKFAELIRGNESMKARLRKWMDTKVDGFTPDGNWIDALTERLRV